VYSALGTSSGVFGVKPTSFGSTSTFNLGQTSGFNLNKPFGASTGMTGFGQGRPIHFTASLIMYLLTKSNSSEHFIFHLNNIKVKKNFF
jgi:hypothetical protein